MHQTLKEWAATYRDGVFGKESIVARYALTRPSKSTQQDDFVGRMLWALSDKSGLPAKRFAEFNPVPPFEWLAAFSEERFQYDDLGRFGVSPRAPIDTKLRFSLIRRPTPYNHASWMALIGNGFGGEWDKVMIQIARWLIRHLDDPRLMHWLSERGGQLHGRWHDLLEGQLDNLAILERDGKTSKLDEIRAQSPKAIPRPMMRTLWRLLLAGRVKPLGFHGSFYLWKDRLECDGLSATLRLELRELLAPMMALEKPLHPGDESVVSESPQRLSQLAGWKLVPAANHVQALRDLASERWQKALPTLLEDFQQLLRDALGLLREIGEATDHSDRSHWHLPSISPHWQNRGFHDWVALIELLRDAWLAVRDLDPARAARIAQEWFEQTYPTFKRLAFFAASKNNRIVPEQWVNWLLADGAWWLWSKDTKREVLRLLVLQGSSLTSSLQDRLVAAILAGSPREMYPGDLEPEHWRNLAEHSVWLRLAKLEVSGLVLGDAARKRLADLSTTHPEWQLAVNESDEFSYWLIGTGDPGYEESRVIDIDIAPRKRHDLVQWLQQSSTEDRSFHEDTWRETCRTHPLNSLCALNDLAQKKLWPTNRWREALQVWCRKDRLLQWSWRYAAPLVQTMPNEVLKEIAHGVTWWLQSVSESITQYEDILLNLCCRVLKQPLEPDSDSNGKSPVTEAINHPIEHVTQALLNLWFKRKPNDNDGLLDDIKPLFTKICDIQVDQFRHGRVLLASRLIALFRVDRSWTEQHLLPLFQWTTNPTEAKAVWQGFLWSPRLYTPLLTAFKQQFLETVGHYDDLGEHGRPFVTLLTYAALEPIEEYTEQEFQSAIRALPQKGLQEVAQTLSRALESAGEQRENYWKNRIKPFWQNIWPKLRDLASSHIAESLARMSIAAGDEFPSALDTIYYWLQLIEHPHYVVHQLHESGLCARFPKNALKLLHAIIHDQQWMHSEFGQCLDAIEQAAPGLAQDARYQRLMHSRPM